MLKRIRVAALLASIALLPSQALAVPDGFAEQVEALLEESVPADGPGVSVIVTENAQNVFVGARGMANIEQGAPITPETQFRIGSITKQFAAAVILQLAQEGKLSLDDPLSKFLPDYPEPRAGVTVRQLLNHTSGIPSYTSIPGWMNETNMGRKWTTSELIDVFKSRPADFAAGESFLYNNSGYILVGAVIEAVTGKPWDQAVVERISQPLGLASVRSFADEAAVREMATGYTTGDNGAAELAPRIDASVPGAAGALRGNVIDLAAWANALHGGKVLGADMYGEMTRRGTLANGETINYALGLDNSEFRGRPSIGHGGGINGFNTASVYLPDHDVFVAVFNNTDSPEVSANTLMAKVAALAIGEPFEALAKVPLDMDAVAPLLGEYRISDNEGRKFYERDGKLYTLRTGGGEREVFPAGDDRFFYGPSSLTWFAISRGADDVLQMAMYQDGASEAEISHWAGPVSTAPAVVIAPELLASYAGTYTSEIGTLLLVVSEAGELTAKLNSQPALNLVPQSETVFAVQGVDATVSLTVVEGKVTGAVIGQGGREMALERMEADS